MKRSLFNRQRGDEKPQLRVVRNTTADEAEMSVYDEIGAWYGIQAKDFVRELKALDVSTLHLRINSPGGSVFDAFAMVNALREHKAKVVVHIDALAASAASYLALAGDEIRMADNAFFMIHNPWTIAMGTAEDFRAVAETLDKIGGNIVNEYMKRANVSQKQVERWMDDETWFTAEEAKDAGFIDTIVSNGNKNDAKNSYDLSIFANVPAALSGGDDSSATKRKVERALRDAGMSRSEAKAIAALAPSALNQRDAGDDDGSTLLVSGLNDLLTTLTK